MRTVPALVLLSAACAAPGQPTTPPEVLDPTLALDLPMGDADSVLVAMLQDATRLSDGRIALLDIERSTVLLVTAEGGVIGSFGGPGGGPGEFRMPTWLGRCVADSLYVWDRGQARVSILTPDGEFARQVTPAVRAPFQPGCLANGQLIALDASRAVGAPAAAGGKAALILGSLVFMSPEGDSVAAVPDLVLGEAKVIGQLGGMAILGDRVVVGLNSTDELTSYAFDGTRLGETRVGVNAAPLSDPRFEAMVEIQAASTGGDSSVRARLARMIIAEGKPELAPLFSSMHGAPDGTVWWVTSLPSDTATTLMGFREEEAPTLQMTLPAGVEVFEIGSDYLLGKRADESGFERLVLWRW